MANDHGRVNLTSFADVSWELVAMEGRMQGGMDEIRAGMDEIRQMIANLALQNNRNNNNRQIVAGGERTLSGPRPPNEVDSSSKDEEVADQLGNIREETKKIEISTFSGTTSIEDFLDWLSECEKFFAYAEIAEARHVKVVAWKLKGSDAVWWDEQQAARVRQGKRSVHSWRKLQSMFRERFLPSNYEQVLFEKYHGCVQGARSVQEYSQEFFNLSARNQLMESPVQQTALYLNGLKANIRDRIGLQRVNTPAEVEELAVSAELLERNRNNQFIGYRKNWRDSANSGSSNSCASL